MAITLTPATTGLSATLRAGLAILKQDSCRLALPLRARWIVGRCRTTCPGFGATEKDVKMRTLTGNVLDAKGLIVHGCNALGVMGAGVALAIKARWPHVYNAYRKQYEATGLSLGTVLYVPAEPGVLVANAITQESTGDGLQVSYSAIRECFQNVSEVARESGLVVHYPRIGAGLGGGDWEVISKIIDKELAGCAHYNWVFEPKA